MLWFNVDEELNWLWLCCQTNTAFDHALEKGLCTLDLTGELRDKGDEGGKGKQAEMKVNDLRWQKKKTEQKNDEKRGEDVLMRAAVFDLQAELLFLSL